MGQQTVEDVILAAQGQAKLRFPELPARPEDTSLTLLTLARKFSEKYDGGFRRNLLGGTEKADAQYDALEHTIDGAIATLKHSGLPGTRTLEPALMKAIFRLEVDYNSGSHPLSKTSPPMNVNYELWKPAFVAYNARYPQTPITAQTIAGDPATNITAAGIVLSTIDAALDPNIGQPMRRAMIASLYGNTEMTLRHGGPIMYAGKTEEILRDEAFMAIPPIPAAPELSLPQPATPPTKRAARRH